MLFSTTVAENIAYARPEANEREIAEAAKAANAHDFIMALLPSRPDAPVIVAEGEWCADALTKAGLLSTTSGAADSAEKADWGPLAGRDVIIWPDNDEAGQRYAEAVAEALRALGCTVRVIDVAALGLPPKGDAVDWLAANPDATAADVLGLTCVEAPKRDGSGEQDPNAAGLSGGAVWPSQTSPRIGSPLRQHSGVG